VASDLERLDRQRREAIARAEAAEARLAELRMDLVDWQEQAEIRSLGVQMASEQRDLAFEENDRLRARLAEVEAERDWMVAEREAQFDEVAQSRSRAEAAEARLAAVEAGHEMTRRELQRYQSHVHDADGFTAQAAQRALDATARAEAAEAERDQVAYDRDCAREAGLVYQRQYHEVKAALVRVEAVHSRYFDMDSRPCDAAPEPEDVWRYDRDFRAALRGPQDERHEFRPGPFECAHHTGGMNCGLPPDDPIHRGPQDEGAGG
jgi:chromosome segregation ATPase